MSTTAPLTGPNQVIYTAEQIRIPPALPDILKNYTKSVLKDQPEDIIAYSVEYFQRLQKNQRADKGLTELQLDSLYSKLSKMGVEAGGIASKADISAACEAIDIPQNVVSDIFRVAEFGDKVYWLKFWAFAVASGNGDIIMSIETAQKILRNGLKVPVRQMIDVFQTLAAHDNSWTNDRIEKVVKAAATNEEYSEVDFVKLVKDHSS